MRNVNMHEAKSKLSRLVEQAVGGEEIIIARSGKPIAKLTALRPAGSRKLGLLDRKGLKIPDDFNRPLPASVSRTFGGAK